jgi:hypothetical protein
MSDEKKIIELRRILKPVIDWYEKVLQDGEPDGSYLYDTTYEVFNDNLSRGAFQNIIEILRSEDK